MNTKKRFAPFKIGDKTFTTYKEAGEYFNVAPNTIMKYYHLNDFSDVLSGKSQSYKEQGGRSGYRHCKLEPIRIGELEFSTYAAAGRHFGVSPNTVRYRDKQGRLDDFLTGRNGHMTPYIWRDIRFDSLAMCAKALGRTRSHVCAIATKYGSIDSITPRKDSELWPQRGRRVRW